MFNQTWIPSSTIEYKSPTEIINELQFLNSLSIKTISFQKFYFSRLLTLAEYQAFLKIIFNNDIPNLQIRLPNERSSLEVYSLTGGTLLITFNDEIDVVVKGKNSVKALCNIGSSKYFYEIDTRTLKLYLTGSKDGN